MAPNQTQPQSAPAQPAAPPTPQVAPTVAAIAQEAQRRAPAQSAVPVSSPDGYLELPIGAIGRVDVGRLLREMEGLDNFLSQAAIRQPGTPVKLPRTSKLLDETIANNKLNVLREDERNRLLHFLMEVYGRAPILHISFSADPSPAFTQKLVAWLRREIHPLVLVQVGLQPTIGAGCVVRTTNKSFDFSLRHRFTERRAALAQYLRSTIG